MSNIKSCFRSRWPDGYILEADFSQLEVVWLAVISGDETLTDDILSGRDMHRMRAAQLFHVTEAAVTDQQRRIAKQLSFQLQYGAGAASMATTNNVPKKVAQDFIMNYYKRYERVKEWQDSVMEEVITSRVNSHHTPAGYPAGRGTHVSPTGRTYVFSEYDAPAWSRNTDPRFSPTEVKNYPIQGGATGDLMALYRGKVYRNLLEFDTPAVAINTVHDSMMFDCFDISTAYVLIRLLEEEAAALPEHLLNLWGIVSPIPFKMEYKIGKHWGDMTKMI